MALVHIITHPEILIDPAVPVPDWALSPRGAARMRAMLAAPFVPAIRSIFCSTERKAFEAASILGAHLSLPATRHAGLGENDRSATGYLPRAEFEQVADQFFAEPLASVRGWERAVDAQARFAAAVADCLAEAPDGDVAIVAHGAVAALLLARLTGAPISRALDQPGEGGGNRYAFDRESLALRQPWVSIG